VSYWSEILEPHKRHEILLWRSRLSRLRPGLYKLLFEEIKKGALQAILLGGSEGDVWQWRGGAGSPLKRSGPWGFAVAERGFRGVARGSTQAFCCGEAL
jgi:hypothetical protein